MLDWLENRISFLTSWRRFLEEKLPARVGWPHVLGSVVLALLGFQFLTGLLLSFFYSPSPDGAHASVKFVSDQLQSGSWLRALHYWGASFVVVAVLLHLIRTFLYAAYRKPRELTWIAGVLLLFCIFAFGQTGYLLPWDQRAYWGTAVTLKIVASIPWIGPHLAQLLQGGASLGALTLSRFYSIHVVVLPMITILLVAGHLLLIRRFGITDPWSRTGSEGVRTTPFYPYQMARDSFAILVVLGSLILLSSQLPAPLDGPADPADATFVPRPDWYFLFLFQLLRYFEGRWEWIGTFVIPASATLVLLLLPFLDQNPRREFRHRPVSMLLFFGTLTAVGWLTFAAIQEKPHSAEQRASGMSPHRAVRIKRPSEVGGMYLLKQYCFECHSMTQLGDRTSLQTLAKNEFPTGQTWFDQHLQRTLPEKQVQELMSVLRLVAGDQTDLLVNIPAKARFGAHFFYNSSCPLCHTIDGQGGKNPEVPSPDLTLRLMRTKEWHIKHIHDPQSLVRNSKMPPFFHYEPHEYDALAEYILYLHAR